MCIFVIRAMSLPSGSAAMFSASARGVRVANGVFEISRIVGRLEDELKQSKELNKRLRDHIDKLEDDAKRSKVSPDPLAAAYQTLVSDKTELIAQVETLGRANDGLVRANEGLVEVNKDLVATNELLHSEIQRLRKKD